MNRRSDKTRRLKNEIRTEQHMARAGGRGERRHPGMAPDQSASERRARSRRTASRAIAQSQGRGDDRRARDGGIQHGPRAEREEHSPCPARQAYRRVGKVQESSGGGGLPDRRPVACGNRPAQESRIRRGGRSGRRHRRLATGQYAGREVMPRISMYCTAVCPYCVAAERLLKSKGVAEIAKIRVDLQPARRMEMMERTGRRTVPQNYIEDRHVGGFERLAALDASRGLDPLLRDEADKSAA